MGFGHNTFSRMGVQRGLGGRFIVVLYSIAIPGSAQRMANVYLGIN